MKIRPTVGRKVWYRPVNEPDVRVNGEDPCDATVVAVHGEGKHVNLVVLDVNGNMHVRTSVHLVQEGEDKPDGSYAEWMPYQKGQAPASDVVKDAINNMSARIQALEVKLGLIPSEVNSGGPAE